MTPQEIHHQVQLMAIVMRIDIETIRARKAQTQNLRWFLRRISTKKA